MTDAAELIRSGILEMYVLGCTTTDENTLIRQMAMLYPEVEDEIEQLSIAMENYASAHAVTPPPTIEPFLMATIDYTERLKRGEQATTPPRLSPSSRIEDFSEWLQRPDLQLHNDFAGASAHIIGFNPHVTTAIVWLALGAPPEIHTTELESFLIVEGSCCITIGENTRHLKPGDYLAIPLHETHFVQVTSSCPCKLILERAAA